MNQESVFIKGENCTLHLISGTATELLPNLGDSFCLLDPTMSEGAGEKHLPSVSTDGSLVEVKVGSILHPMSEEHSINWIYLQTRKGGQFALLKPTDQPSASFFIAPGDEALCVYAYCNLHGFWKTILK